MRMQICLASLMAAAISGQAIAFETQSSSLPLFAQNSFSTLDEAALKGKFYSGIEPFSMPMFGGAFGSNSTVAYSGYYKAFKNKAFTDIRVRSGFSPSFSGGSLFGGHDFASVSFKTGYNFGRFRPYVSAGFGALTARKFPATAFSSSDNSHQYLFGPSQGTRSFTRVGAGVDFSVTNNVTLGVSVSAGTVSGTNPGLRP